MFCLYPGCDVTLFLASMNADEGLKYLKFIMENSKPGEPIYSYAAHVVAEVMFKKGQV